MGGNFRSILLLLLLLLLPIAVQSGDAEFLPMPSKVIATMGEGHVCATHGCSAGDHIAFQTKTETHPTITNCDISTTYTTDANVASMGRCRLAVGVYRIFLSANFTMSAATCYTTAKIYNTTTTFPESGNASSTIEIWLARNDYSLGDSVLTADMGVVSITTPSWIEAIFTLTCSDLTEMDGGHMVIEKIADYTP